MLSLLQRHLQLPKKKNEEKMKISCVWNMPDLGRYLQVLIGMKFHAHVFNLINFQHRRKILIVLITIIHSLVTIVK